MSTENVALSLYETHQGKASEIQALIDDRWRTLVEHDPTAVAEALKLEVAQIDVNRSPYVVVPKGSGSHGPLILLQFLADYGHGIVTGLGTASGAALFNKFWKEKFLAVVTKASSGMLGKEVASEAPAEPEK